VIGEKGNTVRVKLKTKGEEGKIGGGEERVPDREERISEFLLKRLRLVFAGGNEPAMHAVPKIGGKSKDS